MAVTPYGEYAYVANYGSSAVSVITASTSPAVPEFPTQLVTITLVLSMIVILSAAAVAKKRIT